MKRHLLAPEAEASGGGAQPITSSDNLKIVQRKLFGREQSFEIGPDHQLLVSVSSPFHQESWSIPLRSLDPSPTRVRTMDLKPLVLAIPFGLLSLLCLFWTVYAFFYETSADVLACLLCAGFLGAITAPICWVIYLKAINVLTFTGSTGARLPLWFNNPTQEKFEAFVARFKEAILAAQAVHPEDTSLASEIQKLKDLFDRGLLDKDQFESAKNKLTGNQSNSKIGF